MDHVPINRCGSNGVAGRVSRVIWVADWQRVRVSERGVMDATMVLAVCGLALLSGTASWKMAAGKSRRVWLWTALGAILNVPGMLLVAFLPVHRPKVAEVVALQQQAMPAHPIAV